MTTSKCTKSTPELRYRQSAHGDGVNGWIFEYGAPREKALIGGGLEFGVQLRGECENRGRFSGTRAYSNGRIIHVSHGEPYVGSYRLSPGEARGVQVGFVVFGAALGAKDESDRELRFVGAPEEDLRLRAFAEHVYESSKRDAMPPIAEIRSEALGYVARHAVLTKADRVVVAKRELETFVDCDLSMAHVADVARMSDVAMARAFKRLLGITPARYRLLYRVNLAARLLWMRRELAVDAVGALVGFTNRSYFHRVFRAFLGITPAEARDRALPHATDADHR